LTPSWQLCTVAGGRKARRFLFLFFFTFFCTSPGSEGDSCSCQAVSRQDQRPGSWGYVFFILFIVWFSSGVIVFFYFYFFPLFSSGVYSFNIFSSSRFGSVSDPARPWRGGKVFFLFFFFLIFFFIIFFTRW
jgi:hypothetical protein